MEAQSKAVEFLSLAKRHAEDGDIRGAVELTEGALEWLGLAGCNHDRLDEDGICRACGADRRGV